MKKICIASASLTLVFNLVLAQDSTVENKNYYAFSLVGSNYQAQNNVLKQQSGNHNAYYSTNYSTFSFDGFFNYSRMIDKSHSIFTGLEIVGRDHISPDDSLKIKLSEWFVQIPLAFGIRGSNESHTIEVLNVIGPYVDILMTQQVLHPDNYALPVGIKESYPFFSYLKWGFFAQFTGMFHFKTDKQTNEKIGIYSGIRLFGEIKNSAFAKSSDIVYTPAYWGMSYFAGGVVKF